MRNDELSQIIADLPRRVFDRLKQYQASTNLSRQIREEDSVSFKEWKFSVKGELCDEPEEEYAGILIIDTSISKRVPITNLPNRSRMYELIKLSPHIYRSLGLNSAQIVRAGHYIKKGEIEFGRESSDNLGLPIPYYFTVKHKILRRGKYDPTSFFQAFWDLSIKPLIHCA